MQDYCQFQSFNVTCAPDEVTFMHMAKYGRMNIGRWLIPNIHNPCTESDFPERTNGGKEALCK
jgi:hypothetical protein